MPNNLANFIPQVWSRRVIANINQVNVALNFVNTDYEGEIQNAGDTVQVRTFGSITVQDYQRGLPIAAESLVPVKETLTIDKAKYFAFDVDSLDVAQNDINAIDGYTRRAGVAMSNAIDTYIFGFYSSALTANQITNSSSAINITNDTTAATGVYPLIVNAGMCLDTQNVPSEGRWMVVSPYYKSLLLSSASYLIRAGDLGDELVQTAQMPMRSGQAAQRGFFGRVGGFDLWCSANLPTTSTGKYCPYGQGKRICYAAQIPPSTLEAIRLETTFATRVRGLLLHGGQVFAEDSKALGYIYADLS